MPLRLTLADDEGGVLVITYGWTPETPLLIVEVDEGHGENTMHLTPLKAIKVRDWINKWLEENEE